MKENEDYNSINEGNEEVKILAEQKYKLDILEKASNQEKLLQINEKENQNKEIVQNKLEKLGDNKDEEKEYLIKLLKGVEIKLEEKKNEKGKKKLKKYLRIILVLNL